MIVVGFNLVTLVFIRGMGNMNDLRIQYYRVLIKNAFPTITPPTKYTLVNYRKINEKKENESMNITDFTIRNNQRNIHDIYILMRQ